MTQQITRDMCADCDHQKDNHLESGVCTGDLSCQCPKYNPPFLFEFAQLVEKEKHIRKNIKRRVEFVLEKIPPSRNAGERTFYKIYIEIWHGFKIRKASPQMMDSETWKRLPNQDTINREKRRAKAEHPELATYDPNVIKHQGAIFQALLELSYE